MKGLRQLKAIRTHSQALDRAIDGLEDALTTPIGDGGRGRLRVALAVEHAAEQLGHGNDPANEPPDLFESIQTSEPRLRRDIDRLRVQYERLARELDALRGALAEVVRGRPEDFPQHAPRVRDQAIGFLAHLQEHRGRGMELLDLVASRYPNESDSAA